MCPLGTFCFHIAVINGNLCYSSAIFSQCSISADYSPNLLMPFYNYSLFHIDIAIAARSIMQPISGALCDSTRHLKANKEVQVATQRPKPILTANPLR